MIERFHLIEDGTAILYSKGIFRQSKVYRRADHVYAAWAGGYIRLLQRGGTTNPNVAWKDLEAEGVALTAISGAPIYKAA